MQEAHPDWIHFGTVQRSAIRRFRRGLTMVIACVALASGPAIVVGALAVRHDPAIAVLGIGFLAVGLAIAQALATSVDELMVMDGRVRWQGLFLSAEAALSALRSVRPAPWPKGALRLDFGRARFPMPPARGTELFLEALRRLRPDVVASYPPFAAAA